jgi:hypothetical protein
LILVVVRHASVIAVLHGFVRIACRWPPPWLRTTGVVLLFGGFLGWVISLVAVGPLIPRLLGRAPTSFVERNSTRNELTGHGLVAEATAVEPSLAWITRRRLRGAVAAEVVLFVAAPVLAIVSA